MPPNQARYSMKPYRGQRFLSRTVSAHDLGFRPQRVRCLAPTHDHRTAPYAVPKTVRLGTQSTTEDGSRFTPSPFAVIVENDASQVLVSVIAKRGWHRWNFVRFDVSSRGVTVRVDLEGYTLADRAAEHVTVLVVCGRRNESAMDLLAKAQRSAYPAAFRPRPRRIPGWWWRPIYCAYGDQASLMLELEGPGSKARGMPYCIQGLHERWLRRFDKAGVPVGTIIIDAGWSPGGVWAPNPVQWPDLRGFIKAQHKAARRVLLWIGTWCTEGLPDAWCVHAGKVKLVADPTHPEYRAFLRRQVRRLLSAGKGGYDADGFKIDQLSYTPTTEGARGGEHFGRQFVLPPSRVPIRLHDSDKAWGCELLYSLQRDIYLAAKSVKPDALISSSTVHPYFHNTFDMVRLHDTGSVEGDVFEAMKARADLARAVLPGHLIDADDWIIADYDKWLDYTLRSWRLGVPTIFYAERFVRSFVALPTGREIPLKDLRRVARMWRRHCPVGKKFIGDRA